MAGHSKWNNIKRKKEKTDAQRGKIFTKMGREITVAVKEGGPNPNQNTKLRDVIAKAKALNVPNDNIERVIKKANDSDQDNYEALLYEGYGPNGVAVIVSTLTDNRNRTAGEIRHAFSKNGGNLGQSGSVTFLFERQGVIVIENDGFDEDTVMEQVIEAGAEDFDIGEEAIEIYTAPDHFPTLRNALEALGYSFASADIEYIASTEVVLSPPDKDMMEKLIDMLEDNDDVQTIWHNWSQGVT